MAFKVRDKPAKHKADNWARVVGVFVLGKEWQFKDIFKKGERSGSSRTSSTVV